MGWLDFIAQMSNAWAWPAVAGGAIILLRKQITSAATSLVGRVGDLRHLKGPGFELDFAKMRQLAATTKGLEDEALPAVQPEEVVLPLETPDERLSKYQELAALDPRAAILMCFVDLETLVRQEFQKRYPESKPTLSFRRMVDTLESDGVLDPDIARSMRELMDLRNRAVHGQADLDASIADYYVQSVDNILGYLLLTGFFKEPGAHT